MAANPSIQLGTDGNWAIKEDNLLAYKKDGTRFFNKEFDFTRGSLATFVDKDGLIKVSGVTDTELVTNGNFDTDSDWTLGAGWSISGGKANCDGTNITYLAQSAILNIGKSYKVQFDIVDYTSGSVKYRDNGLVSGQSFSGVGSYTDYVTAGGGGFRLMSENFIGSIDNISVVEIQTDVPRIDFTSDTKGHLLLEPQSINLITYSEDFSQWTALGTITTTSNYGISPGGTNDSTRILFSGGSQQIYKNFTSSSGVTGSIYIKGNSGEAIKFGVTGGEQIFTLNGDWQRLTTYSGSSTRLTINTYGASSTARDIQVWGAQAEEGNYATSYIPTYGSTATRNADLCNNSGSAQDFNSEEGVLYAEIAALANDGTNRRITISDGTTTNRLIFQYRSASNEIAYYFVVGGVNQCAMIYTLSNATQFSKIALKYKTNDFALWVDGTKVMIDTFGDTMDVGTLSRFDFDGNTGLPFYGKTKCVAVYKEALTDNELQQLTT